MRKCNIIMVGLIVLLSLFQRICLGIDRLVPSQYPTIQGAIDAAAPGDTVVISPGIYAGEMNSNVHVPASKPIIVRSIDPTDPNVVAGTVIDCFDAVGGYNPAFLLEGGGSVVINGLTIINGYNYQGGGVMFRNAFAILRNCVFEDCFAFGNGGTIYSENSIIVCSNCIIRNSLSDMYGGAVTSINSTFEMHGCTIEGGFARNSGGAIDAKNSKLTLTDCALNDNWSENNGGALSIRNSTLSIKGGEFVGNTALGGQGQLQGGGIYVEENPSPSNNLSITDSKFIDNFASGNGGGIYCRYQPLTVARSYFIGNIAQQSGGGIYCQNGIELTESVLAGNSAALGGTALHSYGLSQSTNSIIRNCTFSDNGTYPRSYIFVQISNGNAEIVNSIFWGTPKSGPIILVDCGRLVRFAYNNVQDGKFPCGAGVGNIQVDPMFVKPGVWQNNNYIPGDYHLKLESPCINAGDPNAVVTSGETDIEGNPRLRLGRVDMGAYELPSHPMDFDESGRVDFKDFARFAEAWLWQAKWAGSSSSSIGLVAYYPFNGNANDASGNGNNGTVVGAAFETYGDGNTMALHFNGNTSSYVVVPRSASLEPVDAISISMWVKGVPGQACGQGWGTILRKADDCQPGYFIKGCNGGTSFWLCGANPCGGENWTAGFPPFTGTSWQHIVGTYSRTDGLMKSYEDGVLVNQTPLASQLLHTGNLYIGGADVCGDDGGFNGLINEVQIYNRALSTSEVQQLYLSGSGSHP